jgi:hypothetical protein
MRIRFSLAFLTFLLLTASSPPAQSGDLILPDLRTLPPTDFRLVNLPGSGIRRLRFANTIANGGPGDLDLHATPLPIPGTVRVFQAILTTTGETVTEEAGMFGFHNEHSHWHWEGFALYEVLELDPSGKLGEVLARSDKIGYCLIDVDPLPGAVGETEPFFTSCAWRRQGISAGWTDTYEAHVGGQFVEISSLRDGLNALRSTVDPENVILELNEENNSAIVYFRLDRGRLTILESPYTQAESEQGPR